VKKNIQNKKLSSRPIMGRNSSNRGRHDSGNKRK